jgi:hypothetical protein
MLPFAAVAEMDHEAGVGIDLGVSLRLVSSYEDSWSSGIGDRVVQSPKMGMGLAVRHGGSFEPSERPDARGRHAFRSARDPLVHGICDGTNPVPSCQAGAARPRRGGPTHISRNRT